MTYKYNLGIAKSAIEKSAESTGDINFNIEQFSNNQAIKKAVELSDYYLSKGDIDAYSRINRLASSVMSRLRNISSSMPKPGYYDGVASGNDPSYGGYLLTEDGSILSADNNIGIIL